MRFEAAYGFYVGDSQVWDTDTVTIPDDTPATLFAAEVEDAMLAKIRSTNPSLDVAFVALLNGPMDNSDGTDRQIPVIFVLDENDEGSGTTYRFCSEACQQNFITIEEKVAYGLEWLSDALPDEVCSDCGKPLYESEGV